MGEIRTVTTLRQKRPGTLRWRWLHTGTAYALENKGHATRALQSYPGHSNNQQTVRYTELSLTRFKDFWRN